MNLQHASNIFKIYNAEKAISNALKPAKPAAKPTKSISKSNMMYHLYKVTGVNMTPEQKFQHAVTVRNRTLGPKGTVVSPYLNVEVTADNKRFLDLKPDDINMYRVLQESSCKHGVRRKVAKRSLNALGQASGVCGLLNNSKKLKEIRAGLEFAVSFEEIRAAEKEKKKTSMLKKKKSIEEAEKKRALRASKLKSKREAVFAEALHKLGLGKAQEVLRRHVKKLSAEQVRAVAFCQCDGKKLSGRKIDDLRQKLYDLLPGDGDASDEQLLYPEYPTQDDYVCPASETDDADGEDPDTLLSFIDLRVGECVEVWWEGEKEWYEGEVIDLDDSDKSFQIYYKLDSAKIWHAARDFSVRRPEL